MVECNLCSSWVRGSFCPESRERSLQNGGSAWHNYSHQDAWPYSLPHPRSTHRLEAASPTPSDRHDQQASAFACCLACLFVHVCVRIHLLWNRYGAEVKLG